MNNQSLIVAKVAALKKNFESITYSGEYGSSCSVTILEPLLPRYESIISQLKKEFDGIFDDLPDLPLPKTSHDVYSKNQIMPLVNNLDYVLELYSNIRIGEKREEKQRPNRIFISHGRSQQWRQLQAYIEKDLEKNTLELAQEANLGRTILQKLSEEAKKCSIAIIVMTGDDLTEDGEIRARENVIHEIGFFQGLYGLGNVILLHESDVNIPTNIGGLVYINFPKDTIESTFGALHRELKVLMSS
ncbi:MAG: nucleotide-binding protein [Chitinophagales bacterium]|nr:nucleotide-binding protein [Bacteroidota bacterium]MCB9042954.1 nucleotide-binding protein [Chitinophagales bacterium]